MNGKKRNFREQSPPLPDQLPVAPLALNLHRRDTTRLYFPRSVSHQRRVTICRPAVTGSRLGRAAK
jgi:hypothetical protein